MSFFKSLKHKNSLIQPIARDISDSFNCCELPWMLARKEKILSADIFNRALSEMYKNLIHIVRYNILTARKKIIKNPKFAEKWEQTLAKSGT